MAPKKITVQDKKRARINEQGQGSGGAVIEPNFDITLTNRYLFRDLVAYKNYIGQFQDRHLCECYYFDKSRVTFRPKEDNKIIEYIGHWNWEPLITLFEPYLELTTRTFYANLTFTENPVKMSSWTCGKEIRLTLENIAAWLDLPNEGDETYFLRNWPRDAVESADSYKKWFDRNNIAGGAIYATSLPNYIGCYFFSLTTSSFQNQKSKPTLNTVSCTTFAISFKWMKQHSTYPTSSFATCKVHIEAR